MKHEVEPYEGGDHKTQVNDMEKKELHAEVEVLAADAFGNEDVSIAKQLGIEATGDDLAEVENKISSMTLERCIAIMREVRKLHENDQNFNTETMNEIEEFLDNPDVLANPQAHERLIYAMKLEALLITENSPYAEVRACVDPTDDPEMPSLTFRVWVIGIIFSAVGAFINGLFRPRQPPISISTAVGQLLAYPCGRFMAAVMPTRTWHLFGKSFTLNPGPFNKKEHMLITIMCTLGFTTPYTASMVVTAALPQFYNLSYARSFGYQILNTLGINFLGYGLAGIIRRFIVYPSYCLWPTQLSTLALNSSFHNPDNGAVKGPFQIMYSWTRYRFFLIMFGAMFVYFWFPNFIFQAMSVFSWMTWIAPENVNLNAICGLNSGLGFNPIPTFDWNNFAGGAFTTPIFSQVNTLVGMILFGFMIIAFWYTNAFNTGYLPINSNRTWDNQGNLYNVSRILNANHDLDFEKYNQYSEPWMGAGNLVVYFAFFAAYTATVTYTLLYHRHDMSRGFSSAYRAVRAWYKKERTEEAESELGEDIHFRLMQRYKEVPEWWYMIVLAIAFVVGILGVALYPTNTSPAVVVFGIIMALIFVVPTGIVQAVAGVPITMNVLAEFIGGSITPGNAISMTYFKAYGVMTADNAIAFAGDLKLAHYLKIPPRHTFICQLVASLISSFVSAGIFNFILGFKGICTKNADFKMTCPGDNTFFTAAVFWGTVNPTRIFTGHFRTLLIGFPFGFALAVVCYALRRMYPRNSVIRGINPAAFCYGGLQWAPYNLMYVWPTFVVTWVSFKIIRPRYLAFWSKFNYVLPAAWNCGVAISAIIMFFALAMPNVEIDWWGNSVTGIGCEGQGGCPRLPIPDKGYFGPTPGTFK